MFSYTGPGPFSKSFLTRALTAQSWLPELEIKGMSACLDAWTLKKAYTDFHKGKTKFHLGSGAAPFRFFALRAARRSGEFFLEGDPSLLARPLHELPQVLGQLSVRAEREQNGFRIISHGWRLAGDALHIPASISSQYASALLLSAWDFESDIYFSLNPSPVSLPYFEMTLEFVRSLGMKVEFSGLSGKIPRLQAIKARSVQTERDKSALFVLAALGALNGECVIAPWEPSSLQPDRAFPEVLKAMGQDIEEEGASSRRAAALKVRKRFPLKPLKWDLKPYPDLFPALAVLCSQAEGASLLTGLKTQQYKESHRLAKMQALLSLCGIQAKEEPPDSLQIFGQGAAAESALKRQPFVFSADNDHRIAMAAAMLQAVGYPIQIQGARAVDKSWPEFFDVLKAARGAPLN